MSFTPSAGIAASLAAKRRQLRAAMPRRQPVQADPFAAARQNAAKAMLGQMRR